MKNPKDSFFRGRLRSFKFALKGMWLLITTEDSIKAQLIVAAIITAFGFYFNISNIEWMFQFFSIGLVLVAEALNTAVEKIADFVHEDNHPKIGFIKDVSAGAVAFAAFTFIIVFIITYFPYLEKMLKLF